MNLLSSIRSHFHWHIFELMRLMLKYLFYQVWSHQSTIKRFAKRCSTFRDDVRRTCLWANKRTNAKNYSGYWNVLFLTKNIQQKAYSIKFLQHHKQSYKKMKQMHLASEENYQRLSTEVEEEKRKHQEYILKSEDFVNLLGLFFVSSALLVKYRLGQI